VTHKKAQSFSINNKLKVKSVVKKSIKKSNSKANLKPKSKIIVKAKPISKKITKPVAKKITKPVAKTVVKHSPKAHNLKDTGYLIKTATQKTKIQPSVTIVSKPPAIPKASSDNIKTIPPITKGGIKVPKQTRIDKDKSRYSDAELEEFKNLINEKLNTAKSELKYLQEQILQSSAADSETKFMGIEDGSGTSEKEYLNTMASRQITYITNLQNALIRIENKTYGICRITGKLIPKERLRAVPHATLSIEAKQQQK